MSEFRLGRQHKISMPIDSTWLLLLHQHLVVVCVYNLYINTLHTMVRYPHPPLLYSAFLFAKYGAHLASQSLGPRQASRQTGTTECVCVCARDPFHYTVHCDTVCPSAKSTQRQGSKHREITTCHLRYEMQKAHTERQPLLHEAAEAAAVRVWQHSTLNWAPAAASASALHNTQRTNHQTQMAWHVLARALAHFHRNCLEK